MTDVTVRVADPAQYPEIGAMTVAGYAEFLRGDGVDEEGHYAAELRDVARRAEASEILVALDPAGTVLGAVAYVHKGGAYEDIAFGAEEAEFRMLVVAGSARGRGVGSALVTACIERAAAERRTRIVISTRGDMATAHRMYERLGFVRVSARDWAPVPEVRLLAYALELEGSPYCDQCGQPLAAAVHLGCAERRDLDPPRWCRQCGRRMVVQVTPSGWTARCSEHGTSRNNEEQPNEELQK